MNSKDLHTVAAALQFCPYNMTEWKNIQVKKMKKTVTKHKISGLLNVFSQVANSQGFFAQFRDMREK